MASTGGKETFGSAFGVFPNTKNMMEALVDQSMILVVNVDEGLR
jgi:hypothetical protein